jgi:hypothetical protein
MRDESFITELIRLEKDMFDFKKNQLIGSDSIRTLTSQTGNTWDGQWTSSGSTPSWGESKTFYITFTSTKQEAPFGNLSLTAQINGVNYNPATPQNINGTNNIVIANSWSFIGNPTEEIRKTNIIKWEVRSTLFTPNTTMRFKCKVDATDTGTITVAV